jgi:hypothetical protein
MLYGVTMLLQPRQTPRFDPKPQRDLRKEAQPMSEIPSSNTPGRAARRWRRASTDITTSFVAALAAGENPVALSSTAIAPGQGAAGRRYVGRRAPQAKLRTRGSQPSRGARA